MQCRACRSENVGLLFAIEHVPVQSYLYFSQSEKSVGVMDLRVYRCASCNLIQLLEADLHNIEYEDTLVDLSFSPSYQHHFGPLANEFVERLRLRGKHVIEIGGGSGYFSQMLLEKGMRVSAIEPSRLAREKLSEKGVTLVDTLLDHRSAERLAGQFDALVLLHVLEHIWNFQEFLGWTHKVLRDGGLGVVEVPSVEDAVEHVHLHCFYPEHVNYFSLSTLHTALRMAGYDVLEIQRVRQREYLRAWIRKQEDPYRQFLEQAATANFGLMSAVRQRMAKGEMVALWGAGARGVTLLASCRFGPETIAYAVDSDRHKWGKRMPVSGVLIDSPERVRSTPPDLIIVATTPNYHEEVVDELRGKLNYQGQIGLLGAGFTILGLAGPGGASRL